MQATQTARSEISKAPAPHRPQRHDDGRTSSESPRPADTGACAPSLAYYERGICYARLQKNTHALADYDRALQLKPEMHLALNARGMVYLKQNDHQKAIADFTDAIRAAPNFAPAYQNRGRARQATGDTAGAKADMEKAAELMTQQPPADRR